MNMIMPLVKADGKAEYALLEQLTSRSGEVDRKVTAAVSAILDGVRSRGDDALLEYTRQFDGVDPVLEPVGRDQLGELAAACDPRRLCRARRAAGQHRGLPPPPASAELAGYPERRHHRRAAGSWPCPGGDLCARRHGRLSFVGPDERYPRPASRGGRDHHGYAAPKNGGFNPDVMAAAYIAGVMRSISSAVPRPSRPGLRHRLGSAGGQDRRSRQYLRGDRETVGLRAGGHRYGGGTE